VSCKKRVVVGIGNGADDGAITIQNAIITTPLIKKSQTAGAIKFPPNSRILIKIEKIVIEIRRHSH
jgi:hypothetical protein